MLQTVECRQYRRLSQDFTKFPFPLSCCKTQHRWKQTADWPTYLFFFLLKQHISSQSFVCWLVTTNNRCVGSFVLDKTQHRVSRLPRFVLRCVVSFPPNKKNKRTLWHEILCLIYCWKWPDHGTQVWQRAWVQERRWEKRTGRKSRVGGSQLQPATSHVRPMKNTLGCQPENTVNKNTSTCITIMTKTWPLKQNKRMMKKTKTMWLKNSTFYSTGAEQTL